VQNAQAGSQIVFTYIHRGLVDGSVSFAGGDDTLSTVRRVGEPYTFGFDPAALPRHLSALGLEMIEDVGASQYRERFLHPVDARASRWPNFSAWQSRRSRGSVASTSSALVRLARRLADRPTGEYCALAPSLEEDAMTLLLEDHPRPIEPSLDVIQES
jgi:hypothetical protein